MAESGTLRRFLDSAFNFSSLAARNRPRSAISGTLAAESTPLSRGPIQPHGAALHCPQRRRDPPVRRESPGIASANALSTSVRSAASAFAFRMSLRSAVNAAASYRSGRTAATGRGPARACRVWRVQPRSSPRLAAAWPRPPAPTPQPHAVSWPPSPLQPGTTGGLGRQMLALGSLLGSGLSFGQRLPPRFVLPDLPRHILLVRQVFATGDGLRHAPSRPSGAMAAA